MLGDQLGVGLVVGVQSVPTDQKTTWAASLRTPIRLGGSAAANSLVSTVPGLASVGVATRRQIKKASDDFLILSGQADFQFGAGGGDVIARKDALSFGLGAEYNLVRSGVRVPVRLGYRHAPSSGALFKDRSALTFGLGYQPLVKGYSVDLSLVRPTAGGPTDAALSVSYRPHRG
jgi:hypothetical protein